MRHIQLHVVPITVAVQSHVLYSFLIGKLTGIMYIVQLSHSVRFNVESKLSQLEYLIKNICFSCYPRLDRSTCSFRQLQNSFKKFQK